ncbi:hypothetical protein [Pseudarthrobacter sp. H2]|uniref:hypothetical protein n=1 Tax=Pseudarthrobacter sp. H2 TaxID=3418415 RepID=UPI003CF30EEA
MLLVFRTDAEAEADLEPGLAPAPADEEAAEDVGGGAVAAGVDDCPHPVRAAKPTAPNSTTRPKFRFMINS